MVKALGMEVSISRTPKNLEVISCLSSWLASLAKRAPVISGFSKRTWPRKQIGDQQRKTAEVALGPYTHSWAQTTHEIERPQHMEKKEIDPKLISKMKEKIMMYPSVWGNL